MTAYTFTDQALRDCACWGLSDQQALYMLDHAAPFTHDQGNWRFEQFLFDVDPDDNVIEGITKLEDDGSAIACSAVPADPDMLYERECPVCFNDGGICLVCRSTGVLTVTDAEYEAIKSDPCQGGQ